MNDFERPLRLCFLTSEYALRPPMGGIATYIWEISHVLVEQGHHVSVVCVQPGQIEEHVEDRGVEVLFVTPQRLYAERIFHWMTSLPGLRRFRQYQDALPLLAQSLGGWLGVRRLERNAPFDIVEVPDWQSLGIVGMFFPKYSDKIILRSQGTLTNRSSIVPSLALHAQGQLLLESMFAHRVKTVLAISEYMRNEYRNRFGILEDRLSILPYGFDTARFTPKVLTDTKIPPNHRFIIGYAGRIEMFKRADILFPSMQIVRQKLPQVSVLLMGRVMDSAHRIYNEFVRGAPFAVWHPGEVPYEQVPELLSLCSVFVFPSTHEPFGRVVPEALACGVPVVTARGSGSAEFIEDGKTGILVKPGDPEDTAQAVLYLLTHPEIRDSMAKAARCSIVENYDIYKITAYQSAFYRKISQKLQE